MVVVMMLLFGATHIAKNEIPSVYYSNASLVKDTTVLPSFNSLIAKHTNGFRLPTKSEWVYVAIFFLKFEELIKSISLK